MDQHGISHEDLHSSEYKSNEIYYNYLKKHKDNPAILLASAKQVYKKFDNLRDNFQKLKKKYQKDRDRWDAWYAKAEKRKTEKQKLKVPLSEASNSVVNSPKKKVKRAIPKERSSEDKENEIDSRVKTEETVLEEYKLPKPTTQVLNEVDVFFIPPSPDRHLLRSNPQKKSPTSLSNQFNPSRPIAESNNTENRGKDKVTESIESKNIKKEEQETETLRRLSSNSRKRPLSSLTRDFSTPATFERKERLSQSVPAKFPISPRKGKRSLPEPSSPERFQKRPPLHLSPSVAKENKGRGRYASMMKK
ncbi:hypothetical protein NEOLI_003018 [Neolecta irregularis DAH-3]|uniref:Uncharacterized protein n=1 Tax=Neolecta irregularis (strain DAH-3) TaxID=1198029 RepID=A0A1U7LTD1_NEOID|nr:hypothetical protein NEOLI_003018 [Neolecta irregularis DAH-3]|eukprot:OLL25843.1 hypothetical protein NEOLI_003018 [Neolecta irregularis DAH-3]